MKSVSVLLLFLASSCFCIAQNLSHSITEDLSSLEGVSFNYQYENGSAISISFEKDHLNYKWIKGPNSTKPVESYPYKLRKLSNNQFYVNWHELEKKNFITLVFDFRAMEAFSSVIVRYGSEKQFTTFDKAVISEFKRIDDRTRILPFSEIPKNETEYNPGNVLKRFVDGLG